MKKFIIGFGLLCLGLAPNLAFAGGKTSTFDIGYSTAVSMGVLCSTGTPAQLNVTRPTGFTARIAGYRIQNQDSADSVWIGGVSVSSDVTNGDQTQLDNLGEKLEAGVSAPYMLGYDIGRKSNPLSPLYCLAADAAGVGSALISVVWFGY